MIYQIDQLVNMTRVMLSRHARERTLLHCHDPDTLHLNSLIASVIEPAAQEIYQEAPVWKLAQSARQLDDDICWHAAADGLHSGHIILPDDYCRLHVLEMSDWHRCVYDAAEESTLEAAAAASAYSGVRGNPWAPRCVVRRHSTGRVLEFHSCQSETASIIQGQYIPLPTIDGDCGMEISQNVLHHVLRRAADKALTIIQQKSQET